jgi:hypothetical protein
MAFAEDIVLSQRVRCRAVETTPTPEKRYGWIIPWRARISATMAKKSRSDPDLKTGRPGPEPIVHIAKDLAKIRAQVPDNLQHRARYEDNIAIHPFTGLHFERRFDHRVAAVATIRRSIAIGVARRPQDNAWTTSSSGILPRPDQNAYSFAKKSDVIIQPEITVVVSIRDC